MVGVPSALLPMVTNADCTNCGVLALRCANRGWSVRGENGAGMIGCLPLELIVRRKNSTLFNFVCWGFYFV